MSLKPYISGFLETQSGFIFLEDVLGIYADRGKPRKPGHWVKFKADNSKGLSKKYYEGLTYQQRVIIEAAGRFNQVVAYHSKETK